MSYPVYGLSTTRLPKTKLTSLGKLSLITTLFAEVLPVFLILI
ncbi:hypothetical protein H477_4453 [[Clostridium] sordellii ATCC 9714]|nr:hypothetical protein H477_4453 [[Clostridium] sordellii ATCC 9714] [Paeniclostridium sordellii ATCC 9714]